MDRKIFKLKLLSAFVLLFMPSCFGGNTEQEVEEKTGPMVHEFFLKGLPMEEAATDWSAQGEPTLREVIRRIRKSADAEHVKGVLLRVRPLMGGWSRAQELIVELQKLREKKPLYCHFDMADNAAYFLMSQVCDKIFMTEAGYLNLVGIGMQLVYLKDMLDNVGVHAEMIQVGKYKGAADPLTQSEVAAPVKESLNALLDTLYDSFTVSIAESRKLEQKQVKNLIDAGPYDADVALDKKLIDEIAYVDGVRKTLEEAVKVEETQKVRFGPKEEKLDWSAILEALSGEEPAKVSGNRLGLITLEGNITDMESGSDDSGSAGPFIRAVQKMGDEDDIKALVLRINSPGGSALASDRMWKAIRGVAAQKPVIVSVGDMAASGGYYIASAGSFIFAQPMSLVGSIGVVGGKVEVSELAQRIGVHTTILSRGKHAAWFSPFRPFSDNERAEIRKIMEKTYDRFIRRVSEGRGLTAKEIQPAAEGRLMTAVQAKGLGLVDELGGLVLAIEKARKEGGLSSYSPIEAWPKKKDLMDELSSLMGVSTEDEAKIMMDVAERWLGPLSNCSAAQSIIFEKQPIAVGLPYSISVQ